MIDAVTGPELATNQDLDVTDADGKLFGVLTHGDPRRAKGPDLLSKNVTDIMPRTIGAGERATTAGSIMNAPARPITALFVADSDSRPVGMPQIHDLPRASLA